MWRGVGWPRLPLQGFVDGDGRCRGGTVSGFVTRAVPAGALLATAGEVQTVQHGGGGKRVAAAQRGHLRVAAAGSSVTHRCRWRAMP